MNIGGFVIKNGLLFKKRPAHVRTGNDYLLVLPGSYKACVLKTAHESVDVGGHLAYRNTANKILRVFFMPNSEIKRFCKTCETCQRLRPKRISERR